MTPLLIAALIAAQSASAGPRPAPPPPASNQSTASARPASIRFLRVVYDERGGTPATGYYSRSEDFTAYIHTVNTICAAGRDSQTRPADAAFGWEITGKFVSRTPSEVIVQLDWRRAWENGRPTREPSGSINLALHPGERVPLDRITTTAVPGACRGIGMTLSVEFSSGTSIVGATASGGGESRGGGAGAVAGSGGPSGPGAATGGGFGGGAAVGRAGGGGGGRVVGSAGTGGSMGGGSVGGDRAAAAAEYFRELASRRGAETSTGSLVQVRSTEGGEVRVWSDLDPRTLQTIAVDVWLVHRLPNGTEESQLRTVQTVPKDGFFDFATVPVVLGNTTYSVDVKGYLQAQRTVAGVENLDIGMIRHVTALGAPDRTFALGGAGRLVPMPAQGEVISLEMPSPRGEDVPLDGHRFSLRLRVAR